MFDTRVAQHAYFELATWARLLVSARTTEDPIDRAQLELCSAPTTPLGWLATRLDLSRAAATALSLLAVCELDEDIAARARPQSRTDATPFTVASLCQTLLLVGASPSSQDLDQLSSLGLIEMDTDPRVSLTRRSVRATDRVVELLGGELRLDPAVAGLAALGTKSIDVEVPPSLERGVRASALVIATGPAGCGRRTLLTAAAHAGAGAGVLIADCHGLSLEPDVLRRQLRAVVRECCLLGVLPLLANIEVLGDGPTWNLVTSEVLDAFHGPVLATLETARALRTTRSIVEVEVKPLDHAARMQLWRNALPHAAHDLCRGLAPYALTPGMLTRCASDARAAAGDTPITATHIRDALRSAFDQKLSATARRTEVLQTWDDLVLPSDQFDQVVELVARVRHRDHVLERWGFAEKAGRGNGVAESFSGQQGTGKTMAAGLIANELGLDLYQVDLSRIVSKYIGETEKALGALFDAAESGHAVILFDEADSLFAKRSEVKSSNDRYANLEVNYLLQRLDAFKGICILTTNHESSIDEAFRRRLAVHVRFPMPDEAQREQLWQAMIPARATVEGTLDFERLARDFSMTGGYIKNAAIRAAYLAADEGTPISMTHFRRAARTEYEAAGKLAYGAI